MLLMVRYLPQLPVAGLCQTRPTAFALVVVSVGFYLQTGCAVPLPEALAWPGRALQFTHKSTVE